MASQPGFLFFSIGVFNLCLEKFDFLMVKFSRLMDFVFLFCFVAVIIYTVYE